MGSRFQSRRSNGRFQRNTLENTFGLSVKWCPSCRRGNPWDSSRSPMLGGQPAPTTCHACGAPLDKDAVSTPGADNGQ